MIAATFVALALSQAGGPPLLAFDDALKMAEEKSLDLEVARAKLGQAQLMSRKVWANYLPQLSVAGGYTRNSDEAKLTLPTTYFVREAALPPGAPGCAGPAPCPLMQGPAFDPTREAGLDNPPGLQTPYFMMPNPDGMITAVIQPYDQWAGQATLTQALIAPALWPAIRLAGMAGEVAELGVESARREILFATAQLYYGAAGLKEALKVQRRMLESNIAHEKDAKVRYEAGALPKVAFLRAQIDRVKAEQDVKRSENGLTSVKSSLNTLIGHEGDFEVALPTEPTLPADLEKLAQDALEARPDLQVARKSLDLAELQRDGVWYQYLPNIGFTAKYQITNMGGFTGKNKTWSVGVGASWTLWDGGLREAVMKENQLKVVESLATRRGAELKAKDEIRRALLDLDSAHANRTKASEQLALARENMTLVNVSYESGAATYLEVTDANAALLGAEINFVAEGLNSSLAALKVLKSAGTFAAK